VRRPLAALAGLGALGACGVLACGRATEKPPNVLVVLWDTTRADHLSLYGYDKPTTPRLDAFAAEAVVYEHAVARGTWTVPTHTSIFTGLPESSSGIRSWGLWLDEAETTVAESLGHVGYATFAFSANLMVSPTNNLTQGFETIHTSFSRAGARRGRYTVQSRRATRAKLLPDDRSTEISPGFQGSNAEKWVKSTFKDAAPVAHQALVDWLDERPEPDRPFFAYLNLMEAHSPRVPSLASRKAISDEATVRLGLATDASLAALDQYIVGKREYTEAELAAIVAVYDAAIRDLDTATGDLLDDLRARGILDDTVVIVVADHGEMLGEHRFYEHRWTVHEPLLHVPLVIRYPKKLAPRRVAERVSTSDLYATILDLAGVAPNPRARSTSLLGRTTYDPQVFAQLLDPFTSQLAPMLELYPDLDVAPWTHSWCAVYEGETKLVHDADGDRHALYDLAADPREEQNLYAGDPERAARLRAALGAWEASLSPYDPAQRSAEDLRHHKDGGAAADDEEAAMLNLLGYTAGPGLENVPRHDFCVRSE
jgi:arylsulfatase A-like enzyme